jgi:predicted nucleotidyltransferase
MRDLSLGRSKTRDSILRLFFSSPDREYYLRELERLLGVSVANVRRELLKLEDAGIFKSRRAGNLRYFSVNTSHPLFAEYRSIVFKTVGIAGTLARILHGVKSVRIAFIFGSVAVGSDEPGSDVDLFVVGGISSRRLHELVSPLQSKIGREINVVLFDRGELRRRIQGRDHFVSSVVEGPKEYLKGNDDDLGAIAGPGQA